MEYLTFLKIMHLVGVMAGFGGALYTDFVMIKGGVLQPLKTETLHEIERLARIVMYGLLLLWISGIVLTIEVIRINPQFLQNDKFWAKVAIVSVLTMNGFFIHRFVLKEAQKSVNRRLLIDSSLSALLVLAVAGSVSFVSWTTPFVLGKAPEFSYVIPFGTIIAFWAFAILVSIAGVLTLVAIQEQWSIWSAEQKRKEFEAAQF